MTLTVVFDLDETLVHSLLQRRGAAPCATISVEGEEMHVYVRPGARQLLRCLVDAAPFIRVAIWTAARATYARRVLDVLLPNWRRRVAFLRTRADCVNIGSQAQPYYVKDLRRLGLPARGLVLLDDNRDTVALNRRHGFQVVRITPYTGGADDTVLPRFGRRVRHALRHGTLAPSALGAR